MDGRTVFQMSERKKKLKRSYKKASPTADDKSKRLKKLRKNREDEAETLEIIDEIRAGNKNAYQGLMDRYKSQVAGVAYRMVGDYDDAKDVTQLVFVKMVKNLHRYDPSKRFSTWLYRITVNASIDYIRKHKRHTHEDLENYSESLENFDASPADIYHRKYIRYLILKAAERLNDKQRAAFILKDFEGHEVSEVAEILDMPPATVRWYIHRARLALRRELKGKLSMSPTGPKYVDTFVSN